MTENKPQTREITIVTESASGGLPAAPQGAPAIVEEAKVVQVVKKVAYTIKDAIGGEIEIYETAAGWWRDVGTVRQLITALKIGHSPRQAALRVGISKDKLYYFIQEHPHFSAKVEDFKEVRGIKIIDAVDDLINKKDPATVRWAAEKVLPEFAPKEKAPMVIIPISMREDAKDFLPIIEHQNGTRNTVQGA